MSVYRNVTQCIEEALGELVKKEQLGRLPSAGAGPKPPTRHPIAETLEAIESSALRTYRRTLRNVVRIEHQRCERIRAFELLVVGDEERIVRIYVDDSAMESVAAPSLRVMKALEKANGILSELTPGQVCEFEMGLE